MRGTSKCHLALPRIEYSRLGDQGQFNARGGADLPCFSTRQWRFARPRGTPRGGTANVPSVSSEANKMHDGTGRHQQALFVAADHPVFAGHFPDAPVVPAVLLLSKVLDAAEQWLGAQAQPLRLRQAKFPAPWLPGMQVRVMLERADRDLRFEVSADERPLAIGVFELQAPTGTLEEHR
jgi:3-hydroxyacyl-[acyl-carrier-protein] dehydratase